MGCAGSSQKPKKKFTNKELSEKNGITLQQVDNLEKIFKQSDSDGDGKITVTELGNAMEKVVGYKHSEKTLTALMQSNVGDGTSGDTMEFHDFVALMSQMTPLSEIDKKAAECFATVDKDNDGVINANELREALKLLKVKLDEEEIQKMIINADKNRENKVNKKEFLSMYRTITTS